jgi:small subunit ribosomal protein S21
MAGAVADTDPTGPGFASRPSVRLNRPVGSSRNARSPGRRWLGESDRVVYDGELLALPRPPASVEGAIDLARFARTLRTLSLSEIEPVVKLRVRSGESIQEAVRRFRKLCERSGLRKEMRRKAYYEKPSERRRREELKRLRKARQAARV